MPLAMRRGMDRIPSARFVLPLLALFWLLVAVAAFCGLAG